MSNKKIILPKWLDITLRVIEWSLIGIIMFCMLSMLAQRMTKQTPSIFGYSTYTIASNSMEGTYDVGDVVLCKRIKNPVKYQEKTGFKKGDVIAFIAPPGFDKKHLMDGQTVTHRIVEDPIYNEEMETYTVTTKGDNNPIVDKVPIPVDNIEGIVVGSSKGVTKLIAFVTTWYGFLIIIVVPLFSVLIWQVAILVKENSNKKTMELNKENEEKINKIQEEQEARIKEIQEKAIQDYINKEKENNGVN